MGPSSAGSITTPAVTVAKMGATVGKHTRAQCISIQVRCVESCIGCRTTCRTFPVVGIVLWRFSWNWLGFSPLHNPQT